VLAPVQTGPRSQPASYTMGNGSSRGDGGGGGVKMPVCGVDQPHDLAPRLRKECSNIPACLWAFIARSRVSFIFIIRVQGHFDTSIHCSINALLLHLDSLCVFVKLHSFQFVSLLFLPKPVSKHLFISCSLLFVVEHGSNLRQITVNVH